MGLARGKELVIQANSAYVYEEVNATGGQLWFESGFVFIDGVEIDINAQLRSDGPVMETRRVGWTLAGDSLTPHWAHRGEPGGVRADAQGDGLKSRNFSPSRYLQSPVSPRHVTTRNTSIFTSR